MQVSAQHVCQEKGSRAFRSRADSRESRACSFNTCYPPSLVQDQRQHLHLWISVTVWESFHHTTNTVCHIKLKWIHNCHFLTPVDKSDNANLTIWHRLAPSPSPTSTGIDKRDPVWFEWNEVVHQLLVIFDLIDQLSLFLSSQPQFAPDDDLIIILIALMITLMTMMILGMMMILFNAQDDDDDDGNTTQVY